MVSSVDNEELTVRRQGANRTGSPLVTFAPSANVSGFANWQSEMRRLATIAARQRLRSKLDSETLAKRFRCALERLQRYRVIFRIEQTVK